MNADLFRQQAAAFRIGRQQGEPRLVSPPGARTVCLLLLAAVVAALLFLWHNDYARKTTVSGVIESDRAIKRVFSARAATVSAIAVDEGRRVEQGEVLARLTAASGIDSVERERLLAEYRTQLEAVDDRITHVREESDTERAKLEQESTALLAAINRHRSIVRIQADKLEELRGTRDAARPLYEQGILSRLEWGRIRESVLSAEQQLESMRAEQTSRQSRIVNNGHTIEQLIARFDDRRMALEQERSRIRQELARLRSQQGFDVRAPIDGIVSRIYLQAGDAVRPDRPLFSIQPVDTELRARLLIPSHAAGFVTAGQQVNLLYDAFPHQQFGSYPGTLVSVSRHALMPGEDQEAGPVREPYFLAHVSLEQPWVDAYGKPVALRSGMTLKADIILERRSLIDWLLEPLLVMKGRSA